MSKSALLCLTSTTEVASVTADLDTRCGELYASGGEVLPAGQADSEDAAGEGRAPPLGRFGRGRCVCL